MDLAFVDTFASRNNGVKYLLVALKICQSSINENKVCQRHFTSFQKNDFSKNSPG